MRMEAEALERLREAESFVGTEMSELFGDEMAPSGRQKWLDSVRHILLANKVPIENLSGRWHTKGLHTAKDYKEK
jgi:hypothetical protein